MSEVDYENMTDEDFAKLSSATAPAGPTHDEDDIEDREWNSPDGTLEGALDAPKEEPVQEDPEPGSEQARAAAEEASETETDEGEGGEEPGSEEDTASAADDDAFLKTSHTKSNQTQPDPKQEEAPKTDADPEPEAKAEGDGEGGSEGAYTNEIPEQTTQEGALRPEDAYAKIMAPFKANGREFTPKDPDEVIRLMQMGAGYARKMNALKPNLRMMRALENKGLLDEGKINFLIDLNDRNPAAIQKLLHESKIDPLDLDTSEQPKYTPTNHSVTEEQYRFQETLTDLTSSESGKETAQIIHQKWDKASKEEAFKNPDIIPLIHEQRENGIYSRISDELERQKMLGAFEGVPFIHAYKAVGDYLHSRGELIPASNPEPAPEADFSGGAAPTAETRRVVETRTAKPKATLANDDRVAGTAPPRSTPTPQKSYNLAEMTDEEIMGMTLPNS